VGDPIDWNGIERAVAAGELIPEGIDRIVTGDVDRLVFRFRVPRPAPMISIKCDIGYEPEPLIVVTEPVDG